MEKFPLGAILRKSLQIRDIGDRRQNKEPGRNARMDSLEKTLEFVGRW